MLTIPDLSQPPIEKKLAKLTASQGGGWDGIDWWEGRCVVTVKIYRSNKQRRRPEARAAKKIKNKTHKKLRAELV